MSALVLVLAPTAYQTRAAQVAEYRAGADLVEREGIARYLERANTEPVPAILARFADQYHPRHAVAERWLPAVLRGAAESDLPAPDAVRAVTAPTLQLAWDTDPGHPVSPPSPWPGCCNRLNFT
jgi:3-oxoadipate enol-lactonase